MKIQTATKSQAPIISQLIMTAMTDDCCQYFAGEHHTLADFRSMMTSLVEREDSQYSYLNTLVAIDDDGDVMGAIVGYDGGSCMSCDRHSSTLPRNASAETSAGWTMRRKPERCISTASP